MATSSGATRKTAIAATDHAEGPVVVHSVGVLGKFPFGIGQDPRRPATIAQEPPATT